LLGKKLYIATALAVVVTLAVMHAIITPHEVALRVATTTSLYATGLLDYLSEKFREKYPNILVHFIPVGSGEALRRAAMGDADVVFVHDPPLEVRYVNDGTLINGSVVAYNYFVVVGPPSDPAKVKGLDPIECFRRVYKAGEGGFVKFISRGDGSGTHARELMIWRLAGLDPRGRGWYVESGAGMSETLLIANELGAYTLSDIGTFLKLRVDGAVGLEPLVSGGDVLTNIYSVYIVNPGKVSGVNYVAARIFKEFVTSDEGQELIGMYGVDRYGQPLFLPAEGRYEELSKLWVELSRS